MKYLIDEYEQVFIFPESRQHKDVAESLKIKAIRGGMVSIDSGKMFCFGEAFSLGLRGDKKDIDLIRRQLDCDF